MTFDPFTGSLKLSQPPADLPPILAALWRDAKGDWKAAHIIAQSGEGTRAYDRLHAYLHRREGDQGNARYWYRRCGESEFTGSLQEEWTELARRHCDGDHS